MNEITKIEIESIEGEYLTDTEYRMDQVMKRYHEHQQRVEELKRIQRQREMEMDISMALIRLKNSIAFAEALHRHEVEQEKKKQHSKELDKALMLIFLIIGGVIVKVLFL